MISQPTNIVPSTITGIGSGVIDVANGLKVSWQVNGYSPLTAYKIIIYQNDALSTQKYTTGKIVLQTPFNGTDMNGDPVLFEAGEISSSTLSSAGIVNGYENGYKFIITQWWGNTDTESIEQTSASVFYTRATPSISIDAITNPYTSKDITVTATYSQAQGDTIHLVRWVITDKLNNNEVLHDTGKIATSVLRFYYDGLFNGGQYGIKLYIQTSMGVEAETSETIINVSYPVSQSAGMISACRIDNSPYIQIEWSARTTIVGRPYGTYQVIGGLLRLDYNSYVVWDKNGEEDISFSNPWSFAWRGQLPDISQGFVTVSLGTSGSPFTITVSSSSISFDRGTTNIFTQAITASNNNTFVVVITPSGYNIKQIKSVGGLLPRTDLYPEEDLYPVPATRVINTFSGDITYTQDKINAITVYGKQNCEYLWLYNNTFDSTQIANMTGSEWYEPTFDANTYFLATFLEGLYAEVNGGNGDSLFGSSLYRQEKGSNHLKHICDVEQGYIIARDYGANSRTSFRYYVFQKGRSTFVSAPLISEYITPSYGTYMLCECEEKEKGKYHVIQAFLVSGNLSTGAVSNNNKPTVSTNFTKYPSWQPSTNNYKSGTITSLIGSFNTVTNEYSDTWNLADRIMSLSTSSNPKFLRDTKGAIWQIQLNSSVSMTMDNAKEALPLKMSLPWVEVGDSNEASIIMLPTDDAWERDDVATTTLSVNIATGQLVWVHDEYDYNGSELAINKSGCLVQIGNGYIEPAYMYINDNKQLIATV